MATKAATDPLDLSSGAIAIVAGGGRLPADLAAGLRARGVEPIVVMIEGEVTDPAPFDGLPSFWVRLEDGLSLPGRLRKMGARHVALAGSIERRPKLRQVRPLLPLIPLAARLGVALMRGDDNLLRAIVGIIERSGLKVVGAHQLLPDLVISQGVHTKRAPNKQDGADIDAALEAAKAIGRLDIGQAAVAIGGRAIALEGIEGTDGLLERVVALRGHGRLAGRKGGVLVKAAKPGQERRVDLPSIGVRTIIDAHAAGLNGVAVEADSSLALGFAEMIEKADELGLFIVGLRAGDGE